MRKPLTTLLLAKQGHFLHFWILYVVDAYLLL
jgi:hypothetical protein